MQVSGSCRIPIANVLVREIQQELYGCMEGPLQRILILGQSKLAKVYLNMELFGYNFSLDVSSQVQDMHVLFG